MPIVKPPIKYMFSECSAVAKYHVDYDSISRDNSQHIHENTIVKEKQKNQSTWTHIGSLHVWMEESAAISLPAHTHPLPRPRLIDERLNNISLFSILHVFLVYLHGAHFLSSWMS